MGVASRQVTVYFCRCDKCGKARDVQKGRNLYNGAQAVRSIGWSFGKDGKVLCADCRKTHMTDRYR